MACLPPHVQQQGQQQQQARDQWQQRQAQHPLQRPQQAVASPMSATGAYALGAWCYSSLLLGDHLCKYYLGFLLNKASGRPSKRARPDCICCGWRAFIRQQQRTCSAAGIAGHACPGGVGPSHGPCCFWDLCTPTTNIHATPTLPTLPDFGFRPFCAARVASS